MDDTHDLQVPSCMTHILTVRRAMQLLADHIEDGGLIRDDERQLIVSSLRFFVRVSSSFTDENAKTFGGNNSLFF